MFRRLPLQTLGSSFPPYKQSLKYVFLGFHVLRRTSLTKTRPPPSWNIGSTVDLTSKGPGPNRSTRTEFWDTFRLEREGSKDVYDPKVGKATETEVQGVKPLWRRSGLCSRINNVSWGRYLKYVCVCVCVRMCMSIFHKSSCFIKW